MEYILYKRYPLGDTKAWLETLETKRVRRQSEASARGVRGISGAVRRVADGLGAAGRGAERDQPYAAPTRRT